MSHADPTPRSPADVLRDKAYRLIESEVLPGQTLVRLTILHHGTEQLFQTEYPFFAAMLGVNWYRVVKREVVVVQYRRVV